MSEEHKGEEHGGGGTHEEHEGAPGWLISFADNVSLMMGFLVILPAVRMGPKATAVQGGEPSENGATQAPDMLDFVISVREGFKNPVNIDSDKPDDQPLIRRIPTGGLPNSHGHH